MVPERREQVRDVMIVKPVVRVATVSPDVNEPRLTEQPKLVGGGALGHFGKLGQFVDRSLLVEHRPEQFEPAARSEEADCLGELFGLVLAERTFRRIVVRRTRHGENRTAWVRGSGRHD